MPCHHHRPLAAALFAAGGLTLAAALPATATEAEVDAAPATAPATDAGPVIEAPSADRAAIRAMAGSFEVSFDFRETVATQPGYEITEPYHADAIELVTVIADEPNFISLQHVLVVETPDDGNPTVVKHWRQDWRFQDTELLEYAGHERWERRHLSSDEVTGTWSQAVYQTTDAPRYEAVGTWTHEAGISTWESTDTWRPLPRREYTKRDDYHVVGCINRHVITPEGWVHEQHNRKLVLDPAGNTVGRVAHEIGVNRYTRCDASRLDPATRYWAEHGDRWAEIRAAWDTVLDRDVVEVSVPDGKPPLQRLTTVALTNDRIRDSLAQRLEAYISD